MATRVARERLSAWLDGVSASFEYLAVSKQEYVSADWIAQIEDESAAAGAAENEGRYEL